MTWALDFWYGEKLVEKGLISSGSVFKTFVILVSTGRVIAEAGSMTSDLAKGSSTLKAVFRILDRVTKMNPDDPEQIKPLKIQGVCPPDSCAPLSPQYVSYPSFKYDMKV